MIYDPSKRWRWWWWWSVCKALEQQMEAKNLIKWRWKETHSALISQDFLITQSLAGIKPKSPTTLSGFFGTENYDSIASYQLQLPISSAESFVVTSPFEPTCKSNAFENFSLISHRFGFPLLWWWCCSILTFADSEAIVCSHIRPFLPLSIVAMPKSW